MPGSKKYTAAEKRAIAARKKAMQGTAIGRLNRVLNANSKQKSSAVRSRKNRKGIEIGTEEDRKRVRHRLELKYPKDYEGGGRS